MAHFSLKQMNLQDYWNVVLRRKKMMILPVVIVMVLAIPAISLMTPIYQAETVLISEKIDTGAVLEGVGNIKVPDAEKSYAARDKIISKPYMRQVAEREGIVEYLKQTRKNQKNPITINAAADYLCDITRVRERREMITITVEQPDPKMVASIANTIGEIYVENTVASREDATEASYKFLEEQLKETAENLRQAKDAYDEESKESMLDTLNNKDEGLVAAVNNLNGELINVEWQLEEARSLFEDARSSSRNPTRVSRYADPKIVSLEAELEGLNVQLQRMLQTYEEEWPDVKRLKASILQLENELTKKKAESPNAGMTREERITFWEDQIKTLTNKKQSLRKTIDSQEAVLRELPQRRSKLEELKSDKDLQVKLYTDILQKLNEVKVTRAAEIGRLGRVSKIFDRATEPKYPVKPNRMKYTIMALALGIMIGLSATFLAEYFDHSIYGVEDVKRYFAVPVMGTIPVLANSRPGDRKSKQSKKLSLLLAVALVIGMLLVDILMAKITGKKPMFVGLIRFMLRMIK